MKIFFNKNTLDGKCAGALLKIKHPEAKLHGIDSAKDFIIPDPVCTVYIVGMSFPFEWMSVAFEKLGGNLNWIDRTQEKADAWQKPNPRKKIFTDLLNDTMGPCKSVFHHINGDAITPDFVKLISEFDMQDYTDARTLFFQFGLLAVTDSSPEKNMALWNLLFDENYVKEVVDCGAKLLKMVSDHPVFMAGCGYDVDNEWMNRVPR